MSTRIQAAADDMGFDSAQDLIDMLDVHGLSIVPATDAQALAGVRDALKAYNKTACKPWGRTLQKIGALVGVEVKP